MTSAAPSHVLPIAFAPRHSWAALGLLLAGAVFHVWYLLANCPLDLSGDEAHYWEWSRRLDWSYYSKGPLVAWIIAAGRWALAPLSEALLGNETLAVRGPAILLSVLTGMGVYTLASQTLLQSGVALRTTLLLFTVPILAVGSMLMTIDAPLMTCWTWALVCLHCGVTRDRWHAWISAGILIALGVLAKFTMVLIAPVVGLTLLACPSWRGALRRPGLYVATAIGLAGFIPILVWNFQNDWVSFRHMATQAGVEGQRQVLLLGPLLYAAGQVGVVNPMWAVGLGFALTRFWQTPREPGEVHAPDSARFLVIAAATPWLAFLPFSLITKIQPNWPVLGLAAGLVLLAGWLKRVEPASSRRAALTWSGAIVGLVLVAFVHRSDLAMPLLGWLARDASPWELTPAAKYDPGARLRGWSDLGKAVGEELTKQRLAGREPFILTDDYQTASQVAFYAPGQPAVYCVQSALGDRLCQYDLWPNPIRQPGEFLGRPVLFVGADRAGVTKAGPNGKAALRGARRVRVVEHRVGEQRLAVWSIFIAESYDGFDAAAGRTKY